MVLAHQPKRQLTVHDKKRHGLHRRTKDYNKTYWPYLPMLLIIVLGIMFNNSWNGARRVLGYSTQISISSLLQDTNSQRDQDKLGALSLNSELSQAAQAKANDMVTKNYWSHISPSNTQPWQFINNSGYNYQSAGENLAYGFVSSEDTVSGWMNSAEHRANILNSNYKDVGFGIAQSSNFQNNGPETVVVAMYGEPGVLGATSPKPSSLQTAPAQQIARINTLSVGNQIGLLGITALAAMAATIFIFQHSRAWRRRLIHGEEFIITHPLFDTFCVLTMVVGVLLTRVSGFVH